MKRGREAVNKGVKAGRFGQGEKQGEDLTAIMHKRPRGGTVRVNFLPLTYRPATGHSVRGCRKRHCYAKLVGFAISEG